MPVNMDKLISLDREKEFKATENAMIATIEASSTASRAYAVGEYLYYTGKLHKVTAPIPSGGTITPGTNCTLDKLGDDVSALKSAISLKDVALDFETNQTYPLGFRVGYFAVADGSSSVSNNWSRMAFPINTHGAKKITLTFSHGDSWNVCAFSTSTPNYGTGASNSETFSADDSYSGDSSTTTLTFEPKSNLYYFVSIKVKFADLTSNDRPDIDAKYKLQVILGTDGENITDLQEDVQELQSDAVNHAHNVLFYIANGGKAEWADYSINTPYIDIGTNNYMLTVDGVQYQIAQADVLSAATTAGLTVSGNVISHTSFAIYFDMETKAVKALKGITNDAGKAAISKNPVFFCAHYGSVRYGLVVDYMSEKRIETIEQEIDDLQSVTDEPMPSYYVSHMADKRTKALDNMMSVGKDGETFIFISDIHWDGNNKHSPALVHYLLDNLNINYLINGGDLINEGDKDVMIEAIRECIVAYQHRNIYMPCAFGNHDSNQEGRGEEDKISVNQQYALMQKQAENLVTYFTDIAYNPETGEPTYGDFNFYFDAEQTKTRFIVIDTAKTGVFRKFRELGNFLLETPEGYNVVLIGHWIDDKSGQDTGTRLATLCDGYNSRSSSVTIGSYTFDYSNAKGYIKLILGGHKHEDINWYTPDGVPFVLIDCDNGIRSNATEMPYVRGTTTEQSFGVFTVDWKTGRVMETKVGRGFNCVFNAGVVSVSSGGTETLTPSITPTLWESNDTTVATVSNGTVTAVSSGSCIITAADSETKEYWYVEVT